MIEIRSLTKRFGALTAVDDVSFDVALGTVLGFLGPNGAGKSTTMKMVTGFLTPDEGVVKVGGADLADRPVEVKRRIGYLPEGAPLYGDMTPRAFLGFIAEIRELRGRAARERMDAVVEQVSLEQVLDRPIETLSKGYKRRVGLAQAILHDPPVLILDEPTDGLDPNQKHEVRELIRTMAPDKAIVLSTHILEEVDAVCDRTVIISQGRVVSDGTPGELLARSRLHNAVTLAVRGADANVVEALGAVDGVESVEIVEEAGDRVVARAYPRAGTSIAPAVGDAARARGWHLEELHVERGRLDDVFREITAEAAPDRDAA